MFIYKFFWDGLDKGTFNALYSQDNINKRDVFLRYCGIFVLYATICTVALFLSENVAGIVITAIVVLLLIVETVLFFKCNKEG